MPRKEAFIMTRKNPVIASLAFQERAAKRASADWQPEFPEEVNPLEEGTMNEPINTKKNINWTAIVLGSIAGLIVLCLISAALVAFVGVPAFNQWQANNLAQTTAYSPADLSTGNPGSKLNPDKINVDPEVWSKPQVEGQQVVEWGAIYYSQSGVPNTQILNGSVGSNEALIIDAHEMTFDSKTYWMGVIKVVRGPVEKLPFIAITNGAAQLVPIGSVQDKLDHEYWVKFCRGTIRPDGTFPYVTWDLAVQELDGFSFPEFPGKCPKNVSEDTSAPAIPVSQPTAPASTVAPAAAPEATHERITTGVTGTLSFPDGTSVCGEKIVINGKTYTGCVTNAPAGTVTNGVIWPWDTELVDPLDLSK
jgi:hypothetical protein